jgi:hypothetical protein
MPFDGKSFDRQVEHDEVLELLRGARERVAKGWWQHDFFGPHGEVCAVGALLGTVTISDPMFFAATETLDRCLPRVWRGRPIPDFNDAPGRTQAEVVALFDRAIAQRAAGG